MRRVVRVVGAGLGLLLAAAPMGAGPLRAQSDEPFVAPSECSDPAAASFEDEISVAVVLPTEPESTSSSVALAANFSNDDRDPVFGENGRITVMRSFVLACEAGGVAPTGPDPVYPSSPSRRDSIEWTAAFTTNGRYAMVFEAEGESPTDDHQAGRAVRHVTLAVAPKKPVDVRVSDPTNGIVSVSWNYVDPEPDLIGFEVRRARQGSDEYTTVKNGVVDAKARSVSDAPPAGAWRYQVVAYRDGAPSGSVSRDDTVEVAEPAPSADDPADEEATGSGGTTSGGATGGTGSAGGGTATTLSSSSPGAAGAPRASVDLSNFAAALNARRTQPTVRVEPPDPGFQETLPFDVPGQLAIEEAPAELGADEPNVGIGQQPIADPGERRRSLGFVAFGLLLFVLSMTGLFVKSEVKRADLSDLENLDDVDATELDAAAATTAAAATPSRRRRHRADGAAAPLGATVPSAEPAMVAPLEATVAATFGRRSRGGRGAADPDAVDFETHAPAPAASATAAAAPVASPRRPSGDDGAAAPLPATVSLEEPAVATTPVGSTFGRRLRRGRGADLAAAPRAATAPAEGPDIAAPPVAAISSRRLRRGRGADVETTTAPLAAAAVIEEPPTMAIPETRRRWTSARSAAPPTDQPVDPGDPTVHHHHFDDLRDDRPATTPVGARRRASGPVEAPLDAPGLDVPDPQPVTRRPATARRPPSSTPKAASKPPLPSRRAAKPAARSKATAARR